MVDMSTIPTRVPGVSTTRWLDEREARAWRNLQFMYRRLDDELSRLVAAESSLSGADYVVLVALTDEPEGRLRQHELALKLGWDKTRLSHHLSRMVDRGLVDKQPCPSDRRGFFTHITQEGRRAIGRAAPGHVAAVRRLFIDLLSAEELDVIGDVAARVLVALDSTAADHAVLEAKRQTFSSAAPATPIRSAT